jgi:hypothetical protein
VAVLDVDARDRSDLDAGDLHRVVHPQAGGVVQLGLVAGAFGEEGGVADDRDQPAEDHEAAQRVDGQLEHDPTLGPQ